MLRRLQNIKKAITPYCFLTLIMLPNPPDLGFFPPVSPHLGYIHLASLNSCFLDRSDLFVLMVNIHFLGDIEKYMSETLCQPNTVLSEM